LKAFLPEHLHTRMASLTPFKHVLTHKDLHLCPVMAGFSATEDMPQVASGMSHVPDGAWFALDAWPNLGLPAPIRKLFQNEAA
jgi:A/G-specific adenine glycosylase